MQRTMTALRPLTALAAAAALAGCAQVTVTANTLVNGSARIADATTNAVEGTSDFTTNTTERADAQTHQARLEFVRSQMAVLRREAAAGEGEHLAALAYMMQADSKAGFSELVQRNYSALFTGADNAEQVLDNLYGVTGTPPDMRAG